MIHSLMPLTTRAVALSLVILVFGCGSPISPVASSVPMGPHRGTTLALDENKGFVELVNEREVTDRRNPQPTSIVAYFLQPDGKTPLSPLPTEVNFTIEAGKAKNSRATRSSATTVPLVAEAKSDDSAGAARFASKPGPYHLLGARGTLSVAINGRANSISFSESR
jgi:hypothetical protein